MVGSQTLEKPASSTEGEQAGSRQADCHDVLHADDLSASGALSGSGKCSPTIRFR
jgi:hypothetical protein